jgi:hypothetical protein
MRAFKTKKHTKLENHSRTTEHENLAKLSKSLLTKKYLKLDPCRFCLRRLSKGMVWNIQPFVSIARYFQLCLESLWRVQPSTNRCFSRFNRTTNNWPNLALNYTSVQKDTYDRIFFNIFRTVRTNGMKFSPNMWNAMRKPLKILILTFPLTFLEKFWLKWKRKKSKCYVRLEFLWEFFGSQALRQLI